MRKNTVTKRLIRGDHNRETKKEVSDRGIVTDSTTTSTLNNNAYNMDSENGQGNTFYTSGNNKVK